MELTLVLVVILVALIFTYTNGFHDTANSIATVVGTKVLTPRQAILLAAVTNLIGAFFGIAVAKTVSSGLVDQEFLTSQAKQVVLIATLLAAIFWNLLTWWFGMPSSSTHALVGSLVGASLCAAMITMSVNPAKIGNKSAWEASVKWEEIKDKKSYTFVEPSPEELAALGGETDLTPDGSRVEKDLNGTHRVTIGGKEVFLQVFEGRIKKVETTTKPKADKSGILWKVVVPMVISPLTGFVCGFLMMAMLYLLLRRWKPTTVNNIFGKAQLASSAYMGFSHGMADATKTMGIIALALAGASTGGVFDSLPGWLSFLKTSAGTDPFNLAIGAKFVSILPSWLQFDYMPDAIVDSKAQGIPPWVVVSCALTMAAGTAAGGWKIIKTMGHKMVKLQPVHGFAAETTAATVLAITGTLGMPVSTTHAITTSIMGVGCAKRFSALKLGVIERIIWAWVLTLPATAGVAFGLVWLFDKFGWIVVG
jgi:phosphate/sulfate permease